MIGRITDNLRHKEESLIFAQCAHRAACEGHIRARNRHDLRGACAYHNDMLVCAARCEELEREIMSLTIELCAAKAELAVRRSMA